MTCRCRTKCATDAFTLQAPEMILMESIVPTTEICLTFAELRPPHVLVNVTDLHSKSVMQPLCIGVADFTCTEVRVAGARAKYVLANRRVVKRDSGNIISGAFICLSSYN